MKIQKCVTYEREVYVCDRCGKNVCREDNSEEWFERFVLSFRGGYGSVFGDGYFINADFCQGCIYELLGKYVRMEQMEFHKPFTGREEPEKIYQPYQINEADTGEVADLKDLIKMAIDNKKAQTNDLPEEG
jgi:hypothetical protein